MVLLPEQFGPSSPTTSPSATENDTSRTARRGPYHLTRFCTLTTGALIEGLSGVRSRSSPHTSAIACCAPAHPFLHCRRLSVALGWLLCGYWLHATTWKRQVQARRRSGDCCFAGPQSSPFGSARRRRDPQAAGIHSPRGQDYALLSGGIVGLLENVYARLRDASHSCVSRHIRESRYSFRKQR